MPGKEIIVGRLDELQDPGCREFRIGGGDWPFKGFVVRQGGCVYAYENSCRHVGHPLNWNPDTFLTEDGSRIICASHGALYDIESGRCTGGPCRGKTLNRVDCEIRDGMIVVRGPAGA